MFLVLTLSLYAVKLGVLWLTPSKKYKWQLQNDCQCFYSFSNYVRFSVVSTKIYQEYVLLL